MLFVFLLLCGYGLMALGLMAISKSSPAQIRERLEIGVLGAKAANRIMCSADDYVLAMQVGVFSISLFTGYVAHSRLPFVMDGLRVVLGPLGSWSVSAILLLALILCAVAVRQIAKALAFAKPEIVLCRMSLLISVVHYSLRPIIYILNSLVTPALVWFKLEKPLEHDAVVSSEELQEILDRSTEAGTIEEDEKQMIQGVMTLSDTTVQQVMTPRRDIVSVNDTVNLLQLVEQFRLAGVSRVLVVGKSIDEVRGFVLGKDLLRFIGPEESEFTLESVIRAAYFVPNSKKVDDLLEELRNKAVHFAVVLDEQGNVDGVVTIEDLLEELVGEIFDEYDRPSEEKLVRRTRNGELLVEGMAKIGDLNSSLHLGLPEGQYETIAGLVIDQFGGVPEVGQSVIVGGSQIRVERMQNHRVTVVRVVPEKKMLPLSMINNKSSETASGAPDSNQESSGVETLVTGNGRH